MRARGLLPGGHSEDEDDSVSGGSDGLAASEAIVEITKQVRIYLCLSMAKVWLTSLILNQELDNVVKTLSVRIEDLLTCSNLIGKMSLQDPVNTQMIDVRQNR